MTSSLRVIKAIHRLLHPLSQRPRSPSPRRRTPKASDPFLQSVWVSLRQEFFPDRTDLDDYHISWSGRPQKRVLASCNIRRRRVVVARELFEAPACRWISPIVYHELCHAVLGETIVSESGKRQWHGKEFKALEVRHPDSAQLDGWIRSGGWAMAVRSSRAKVAWRSRTVRIKQAFSALS